jgi:hypothetical protein
MNEGDRSGLENRKKVRGSREYRLVGIDVAKDKYYAFLGTATGKTLFRRPVLENDQGGFRKLRVQAEAMKVKKGLSKVVFGMEPMQLKSFEACSCKPTSRGLPSSLAQLRGTLTD